MSQTDKTGAEISFTNKALPASALVDDLVYKVDSNICSVDGTVGIIRFDDKDGASTSLTDKSNS